MNKKQVFFNFLNELMEAAPEVAKNIPEDAQIFIEALKQDEKTNKPMFTENGKIILQYLKDNSNVTITKAKDIAESLGISSRTVSGAMRKLVSDGFVEKVGKDPVLYTISEKGKNCVIE